MKNETTRRNFMGATTTTGLALIASSAFLSRPTKANDQIQFKLTTQIFNNHRHEVKIELNDLVVFLRKLKEQDTVEIDIKGESRHPHILALSFEQILDLLQGEEIQVDSSSERGHSHIVKLELVEFSDSSFISLV